MDPFTLIALLTAAFAAASAAQEEAQKPVQQPPKPPLPDPVTTTKSVVQASKNRIVHDFGDNWVLYALETPASWREEGLDLDGISLVSLMMPRGGSQWDRMAYSLRDYGQKVFTFVTDFTGEVEEPTGRNGVVALRYIPTAIREEILSSPLLRRDRARQIEDRQNLARSAEVRVDIATPSKGVRRD